MRCNMRRRINAYNLLIGLSVLGIGVLGACSKKSSDDDDPPAATTSTTSSAASSSSSSSFALAGTVASTATSSSGSSLLLKLGLADTESTVVTYQIAGDPSSAVSADVDST